MAAPAKAAGGKLTHVLHGESGFMYNPDLLHALTFKDEWAISPEQFELLTPHMQRVVKGLHAKVVRTWTEKDRDAHKRRRLIASASEPEPEPEPEPAEPAKPKGKKAE